jgi:nicotinamide-nucleotide amidase
VSRGYAERLGRPFADFVHGVRKQASLPDGAVSLGLAGTAPGVLVEHDGRVAVALPGPPIELQRLWPAAAGHPAMRSVLERLTPRAHRTLRFFGPSESAVATVIDAAGGEAPGLDVTVCARDFEIHVDLFVEQRGEPQGAAVESALRERFGYQLFAEDERPVEELVLDLCRARGLTLATAESCTGGMVGARLTDVPGASDVYLGGIVAYANSVKEGALGVPGAVLGAHGAVSPETAAAMAAGVRAALGADVGAAVTGVAGPGGGSPEKPVGLVHLHVETPDASEGLHFELPGDRARIRGRATAFVLHHLRTVLSRPGSAPA